MEWSQFKGGPQGKVMNHYFVLSLRSLVRYAVETKRDQEVDNWVFSISREASACAGDRLSFFNLDDDNIHVWWLNKRSPVAICKG